MNIGFVSTWFERGAAYVTKAYMDALKENHEVFVYARGGEKYAENSPKWNLPIVTWGLRLEGTAINFRHFSRWIEQNQLNLIFFNEQKSIEILAYVKRKYPQIKIGAYIDYYKQHTVKDFWLYDFLICNTKRHYSVFKSHPQCFFIPWGTDIDVFRPKGDNNRVLTFFHSVGMSKRKGTDLLIEAYLVGKLYKYSKLVIHSQVDFEKTFGYSLHDLENYSISIIQKTVGAPGLYHLGDVYVYPTLLEGLGLTLYEALSCGLPVITTDNAPMNEVINNDIGYLVKVEKLVARSDGYYWPLSYCDQESLIDSMRFYIDNRPKLEAQKKLARNYAVEFLDWQKRKKLVNSIFSQSKVLPAKIDPQEVINASRVKKIKANLKVFYHNLPDWFIDFRNKRKTRNQ